MPILVKYYPTKLQQNSFFAAQDHNLAFFRLRESLLVCRFDSLPISKYDISVRKFGSFCDMSTLVLLAMPDVGLVWCGTKSTAEEVSKKVEQAVPMLNRYTTNTCTLPILYRRYTDTYCRYYRGWLLTNGWLIHPPILDRQSTNTRPTLDRYIPQYLVDISTDMSTDTRPILNRYINRHDGWHLL